MAITTRSMTDRVHAVKISGTLTWNDFQIFLRESEALMADGKIGILVELENFAGWESSEQWGDVNFFSSTMPISKKSRSSATCAGGMRHCCLSSPACGKPRCASFPNPNWNWRESG